MAEHIVEEKFCDVCETPSDCPLRAFIKRIDETDVEEAVSWLRWARGTEATINVVTHNHLSDPPEQDINVRCIKNHPNGARVRVHRE